MPSAVLTFDNEGRLVVWQNTTNNPTSTVSYLYDGQGNRVVRQQTVSGTTTTGVVLSTSGQDPLVVYATTNGTTTSTFYYYAACQRLAEQSGGVFWYLASDELGSTAVALSGSTPPSQLFSPYGGVRYSSGSMPTSYGFTGQRQDDVPIPLCLPSPVISRHQFPRPRAAGAICPLRHARAGSTLIRQRGHPAAPLAAASAATCRAIPAGEEEQSHADHHLRRP